MGVSEDGEEWVKLSSIQTYAADKTAIVFFKDKIYVAWRDVSDND